MVPSGNSPEPDPRVYFAAERTFLAWLRTALALMGFGFVVARFGLFMGAMGLSTAADVRPPAASWVGVGLVVLGVICTAAALADHVLTVRRLNRGEPFVGRPTWLGGSVAVLLVLMGILIAAHLVVLPLQ